MMAMIGLLLITYLESQCDNIKSSHEIENVDKFQKTHLFFQQF